MCLSSFLIGFGSATVIVGCAAAGYFGGGRIW